VPKAELASGADPQAINTHTFHRADALGKDLREVGAFKAEIQHLGRAATGDKSRAFNHGHGRKLLENTSNT
jgi:hypothetical protein